MTYRYDLEVTVIRTRILRAVFRHGWRWSAGVYGRRYQ